MATPEGFNQNYTQKGPKGGARKMSSGVTSTKIEYRTSARHDGNTAAKDHMDILKSDFLTGPVKSLESNTAEQE